MSPGQPSITRHRVTMHARESAGLANAAAFAKVLEHGQCLVIRKMAVEQRRALAFAESTATGAAAEHASLIVWPIVIAHTEVFRPAFAVVRAV